MKFLRSFIDTKKPWVLPHCHPVDLIFFKRVFERLCQQLELSPENAYQPGISVTVFQRVIRRLYCLLEQERLFNVDDYDLNNDGTVGWWEFCIVWKEEKPTVKYSLAERIFMTLEEPRGSRVGQCCSLVVLLAIFISAGSFILSTLPRMQTQPDCLLCVPEPFPIFAVIDTLCVLLFTVEYCLRLVTSASTRMELVSDEMTLDAICTEECTAFLTKWQRVWIFVTAWPNLIDLVAILPSYIAWMMPQEPCTCDSPQTGTGMVTFKLIRLMRVVRAIRLGRRLEPVIIVAKTIRKSMRALWVLILNIVLGVLIFGSVIYFMETGVYDPNYVTYMRKSDFEQTNTGHWEPAIEQTPFRSIPDSFWWALVTATTVGYGDDVPKSVGGKITAGFAMIWSLCVLALPVGVVGSNFDQVWKDYDLAVQHEKELRKSEAQFVKKMVGSTDPFVYSRQMMVEVYHDSCMLTSENDFFLGEVEVELLLEPLSYDPVHQQLRLPLNENRDKAERAVSGTMFIDYDWTPREPTEPGIILDGTLKVTLVSGETLEPLDWKPGAGIPDPYVKITLYPNSPDDNGVLHPKVIRFDTKFDDTCPIWNKSVSVPYRWYQSGISKRRESCRKLGNALLIEPASTEAEDIIRDREQLVNSLPLLRGQVAELKKTLDPLKEEVEEIRRTSLAIMAHLGLTPSCYKPASAGSHGYPDRASQHVPVATTGSA